MIIMIITTAIIIIITAMIKRRKNNTKVKFICIWIAEKNDFRLILLLFCYTSDSAK